MQELKQALEFMQETFKISSSCRSSSSRVHAGVEAIEFKRDFQALEFKLAPCITSIGGGSSAFDPLDPFGNITIRTDVTAWTGDGYEALVTIQNLQRYRHIDSPGWSLGWSWAKKEIIWVIIGAETKNPSDCPNPVAAFNPNSCAPSPQFVDLPPKTSSSLRVPNCCKGGVLSALNAQDPLKSVASFIITVGRSGNSNTSVTLPQHFTLAAPGQKYVCSPAVKIPRTQFSSPDT